MVQRDRRTVGGAGLVAPQLNDRRQGPLRLVLHRHAVPGGCTEPEEGSAGLSWAPHIDLQRVTVPAITDDPKAEHHHEGQRRGEKMRSWFRAWPCLESQRAPRDRDLAGTAPAVDAGRNQ